MTRIDLHESSKLTFAEGAAPSTPAANLVLLYAKSDGLLYSKDDAGAETAVSGGGAGGDVATDAIWDAAGDLAVGTGANTAAKLSIGATNGMALRRVSGAVAWAFPPGHELAYAEQTSNTTITATTEATGQSIVSAGAVSFDGSTRVCIEFYCPEMAISGATIITVDLSDGGTEIGAMGTVAGADTDERKATLMRRFLTPSNASHTYAIQAWKTGSAAVLNCGAGGSGTLMPAYIRITVA